MKKYRIFYLSSFALVAALSAYPLYMGIKSLINYFSDGYIVQELYPKYLIPYAPMCFALLITVALMPLFARLFKRFAQLASSVLGTALFLLSEVFFEGIKVLVGYERVEVESWQLGLCIMTPEAMEAQQALQQGKPIYVTNNNSFKVHFYIIALVVILTVIGVLYGYRKLILEGKKEISGALYAQTASVVTFVSLCVLACFTAFYRTGDIRISPLSAALTSGFFIIFGITVGVYISSFLIGKRKLGTVIPAVSASLTTLVMYLGELLLMGGKLFIMGNGAFFEPMGSFPFAPFDIAVILISGIITAALSFFIASTHKQND